MKKKPVKTLYRKNYVIKVYEDDEERGFVGVAVNRKTNNIQMTNRQYNLADALELAKDLAA